MSVLQPSDPHAADAFCGFVSSEHVSARWGEHYYGERHDNQVQGLIQQVEAVRDNLRQSPHLVKMMLKTTALLKGAVGSPKKGEEEEGAFLYKELDGLSHYIGNLLPADRLPKTEDLPEDCLKVLAILEKDTAQNPIHPVRGTGVFLKKYVQHVCEHVREEPKAALGAFGVSLGFLWMVNNKMGGAVSYIDPIATTITNPGLGEFGADYSFDPTLSLEGLEPSCHNHVQQVFGETVADFVAPVLPDHCSKFKTLAEDAQGSAEGVYNAFNSRIEAVIKMPLSDLFGKIVDNEAFMRGFETGARNTADFIYQFNTVENITLHYVIGKIAFDEGRKLGRLTTSEAKESFQKMANFAWRTARNAPLTYALGIGGMGYSYMAHEGFDPSMVWMGLGGVVGGRVAHKAYTCLFNKKARGEGIARNASQHLKAFKNANSSGVSEEKNKGSKAKTVVFSAASVAAITTFAKECPEMAGVVAGGLAVGGSFVAYNVPEDIGLHMIFAVAGGTAGYGYGLVERKITGAPPSSPAL